MAQTNSYPTVGSPTRPGSRPFRTAWGHICCGGILFWNWSVPHRNSHRPDDGRYAAVWRIKVDPEGIRAALSTAFPGLPWDELPEEEEEARRLLRACFPPPLQACNANHSQSTGANGEKLRQKILQETCEEAWTHVPVQVRDTLSAANALNLERKLQLVLEENYHCSAGLGNMTRSSVGVSKTFRLWRVGLAAAISIRERIAIDMFFFLLTFMACFPDVAAGFLGERSYNQRSIGSRIFTLIQLFFLWTFPYHSLWLLFNWSLERLLGALIGNSVYALAAILPAVRTSYRQERLRIVVLVLSACWQIGVQFSSTFRDYLVRLLTRRQISVLRKQIEGDVDWIKVDEKVSRELISHKAFVEQQAGRGTEHTAWQDVPIKVRVERYIQFTATFKLGRCADQLVGLLKDDMGSIINTFEDYRFSAPAASMDRGYVEPRMPKFLLVFLDAVIFTYVCYSFWTQPFTFNTVVAYSSVVIIKQTILAIKRYQTVKGARRLFTNMVSVNILGMLLVSTPVTIDKNVLADTGRFVALTLAMILATLFFTEPIAPILLTLTEKAFAVSSRLKDNVKTRWQKSAPQDEAGSGK